MDSPHSGGSGSGCMSDVFSRTISMAKKQVFKTTLNENQAKLVTDQTVKTRTKWIIFIAAFVDLSGAVILAGAFPAMCANAPGALTGVEVPGAFPASNFEVSFLKDRTSPPAIDFAMAVNLIPVCTELGGIFSNVLAGLASDRFGRKPIITGCLLGGVFSYILMFLGGAVVKNYWFFLAATFVKGLFSGIRGVISAYLQDIHDPVEFMTQVMPTMINFFLFGGMGGSMLGLCWVAVANSDPDPTTHNSHMALFGASWLGVVLSMAMAYLVYAFCPEPAKKGVSQAESKGEKPAVAPMSPGAKKIIMIIIVAGSLDTFGDYGNRFARNTILTNRYAIAREAAVNYVLMVSNIFSIYLAQQVVRRTIAKLGFMSGAGIWVILGNVVSAVTQFTLLIIVLLDTANEAFGVFVAVWIFSQIFGICSSLGAMFLFPGFVPADQKGKMNGIRGSIASTVNVLAPIMLSLIYQTGSLDTVDPQAAIDRAGRAALAVCGSVSTVAFLCYLPLPALLPKPPPPAQKPVAPAGSAESTPAKSGAVTMDPEPIKPLEEYDAVTLAEWMSISIPTRIKIQEEREKAGMARVYMPWGAWDEDRPRAEEILRKAPGEFEHMKAFQTSLVTSEAMLEQFVDLRSRKVKGTAEDPAKREQRAKARAAMGAWIADYLDDAGWDNWDVTPYMYKALIMNALPPLDHNHQGLVEEMDAETMRTRTLKSMRVIDYHLKAAQLRIAAYDDMSNPGEMNMKIA